MKTLIVFIVLAFPSIQLSAQTTGKLDISVTTSSTGGNYAPRNVVAIWIEDESGNFVKTLLAYADKRIQHLNNWENATNAKGSMYNRTDAITGATQSSHGTRTCSWNGTDYNKILVADGKYFVCMELTDKNSTGNFSKFEFTKGVSSSVTPQNVASFSSVNIVWEPSVTLNSKEITDENNIQIFPNPTKNIFHIKGDNITDIEILNLSGSLIFKNNSTTRIDLSNFKNGIYLVRIKMGNQIIIKKLVKE
jgi:hypothetical protein